MRFPKQICKMYSLHLKHKQSFDCVSAGMPRLQRHCRGCSGMMYTSHCTIIPLSTLLSQTHLMIPPALRGECMGEVAANFPFTGVLFPNRGLPVPLIFSPAVILQRILCIILCFKFSAEKPFWMHTYLMSCISSTCSLYTNNRFDQTFNSS